MKKLIVIVLFSIGCLSMIAQSNQGLSVQKVDKESNPIVKILHDLIGEGVELIAYDVNQPDTSIAFGSFKDPSRALGMKKGLLMTSGSIFNALGPNDSPSETVEVAGGGSLQDPILESLEGSSRKTYDACIIELDIIPYADTLSYNFVFGSEEYDEYVFSKFNDIFAFHISGPGIEGARNLALVPGTDVPVAINNVNAGHPGLPEKGSVNPTWYVRNVANHSVEYDGYTRLIEVRQPVTPGEVYHLRLSIADVSDRILDSGVFVEAKSIITFYASHQVNFNSNKHFLNTANRKRLDGIVAAWKDSPSKMLELSGHTDGQGGNESNYSLSEKRVVAVKNYLVSKGIATTDIIMNPRGESMPVADNATSSGRAKNRRVEIKFLGADPDAVGFAE